MTLSPIGSRSRKPNPSVIDLHRNGAPTFATRRAAPASLSRGRSGRTGPVALPPSLGCESAQRIRLGSCLGRNSTVVQGSELALAFMGKEHSARGKGALCSHVPDAPALVRSSVSRASAATPKAVSERPLHPGLTGWIRRVKERPRAGDARRGAREARPPRCRCGLAAAGRGAQVQMLGTARWGLRPAPLRAEWARPAAAPRCH